MTSCFENLYHLNLDAILLTDQTKFALRANDAACRLFGMNEKEICSLPSDDFFDSRDHRLISFFERRKRHGKARGDLTLIRKGGEKFEADVSSVRCTAADGQPYNFIVIHDISQRQQFGEMSTMLAVSEEATTYVRQLEMLLHVTSHRVRQPITSIQGLIGILDLPDLSQAELKRIATYLKDSINSLDLFTRELTEILNTSRAATRHLRNLTSSGCTDR